MYAIVTSTKYAKPGDYVVYEDNPKNSISVLDIAIIESITTDNKLVVRNFGSTNLFFIKFSQIVNIDRRMEEESEEESEEDGE